MSDPTYFDFNASTPLLPAVLEAMTRSLRDDFGNPSSGHVFGQRAKASVERARGQVALLLGCEPDEVLFTSGGTESNNLALVGLPNGGVFVTSVIEHPATLAPLSAVEARVERLSVDRHGRVVVPSVVPEKALVSVMHSNNETGVLQPIAELAKVAHAAGGLLHTDASQSVGKVPVDVRALDVDALTVCAHKLYAPKGVGALFVRRDVPLKPFMRGASHERGLRPGTENVAAIAGLGVAAQIARETLAAESARVTALRDRLVDGLKARVPGLVVHGAGAPRLPNTASVAFPDVTGTALLDVTPELAASTGSACHDGHESASAVILAMGVEPSIAVGTVRLSLGRTTTSDDVDRAVELLSTRWRVLRESWRPQS